MEAMNIVAYLSPLLSVRNYYKGGDLFLLHLKYHKDVFNGSLTDEKPSQISDIDFGIDSIGLVF